MSLVEGVDEPVEFESTAEFNDFLMKEFVASVNAEKEATDRKRALALLIDKQCTDTKKSSGTVKVFGAEYKASIVRGQVSKYPPIDKAQDSLLQILYTLVEEARPAIKLSFEERQAAFTEFLDGCVSSDFEGMEPSETEIIKKVIEARYFQSSQPQVKVYKVDE